MLEPILIILGMITAVVIAVIYENEDSIIALVIIAVCWPFTIVYFAARALRRRITLGYWCMEAPDND